MRSASFGSHSGASPPQANFVSAGFFPSSLAKFRVYFLLIILDESPLP
jgi:hypothetical protein